MTERSVYIQPYEGNDGSDESDWRAYALCAQTDPEAFYPEKGRGSAKAAKAVCKVCTVKEPCLEDALKNGDRFGVYGGLSERERRKLPKDRK
ncbi:MAG TPA: WhiB family transcriptional regulator [Candidatus Saccharimonadales bacterium]|jgi:WhiB family redox-sensing transcriptional regulator